MNRYQRSMWLKALNLARGWDAAGPLLSPSYDEFLWDWHSDVKTNGKPPAKLLYYH